MNVMYAYDENYAEIVAVSILSLLKSNQKQRISFFLIQDNVREESMKKIEDMIVSYGADVTFIEKPNIRRLLGVELKTTLRWSDSTYSRLFLKELFGENTSVEKLLYIDCDTLIVGSLHELWESDISDCLGVACLECMSNMHKKIIGAKKTDNYINAGMLLLNVKRWIDEDIQSVVSDFIRKYKGRMEYLDQGVINGTVSNRFKLISPKYNLTALAYDFTYEEMQVYRKPQFGYSKEEWEEAKADPRIVHFTTSFLSVRPWFEGSKHPYAKLWKQIHEETPWKGTPYRKLSNRSSRDRKEDLYRKMPKCLAVSFAGFLHSYVKPIAYKIVR